MITASNYTHEQFDTSLNLGSSSSSCICFKSFHIILPLTLPIQSHLRKERTFRKYVSNQYISEHCLQYIAMSRRNVARSHATPKPETRHPNCYVHCY